MKQYLSLIKVAGRPLCLVAVLGLVGLSLFWMAAAIFAYFSSIEVKGSIVDQVDHSKFVVQYRMPDGSIDKAQVRMRDINIGDSVTLLVAKDPLGVNAHRRYFFNFLLSSVLGFIYFLFYMLLKKLPDWEE